MTVLRGRLISVKVRKRKREGGRTEDGDHLPNGIARARPRPPRRQHCALGDDGDGRRATGRERWGGRGVPARAREVGPALGE